MSDTPQVERQLFILSLLSDKRQGYTLDELMVPLSREGIDISRKTLERDIDYITENFYVYEEDEKRDGKPVYKANLYNLKNVTFSISDMIALQFAREVLRSYSGLEVGATAEKLLDKLISQGPNVNRQFIETLNGMMKVSVADITPDRPDPDTLALLRDCIKDRRPVRLAYHAFNTDQETERLFDPYLLEVYDGCWHVVGYCHLRENIRDFRVSRIASADAAEGTFRKPDGFYEAYKRSRFDKLNGETPIRLRIRFRGEAARYMQEYEAGKATRLVTEPDGCVIFERNTSLNPEIVRWVLAYGSGAEVLEPESLRTLVQDEIARMGQVYAP